MTPPLYLLDTDTTSHLQRGRPVVVARAAAVPASSVAVSVITVEEQLSGWYTALRSTRDPVRLHAVYARMAAAVRFLGSFTILDYSLAAMAGYDRLLKAKLRVRKNDLRIAAVALEHGATVVTANTVDFARVPGIAVEDWTRP
jgi:tRNA(fMet)-specific endonuclease VapC